MLRSAEHYCTNELTGSKPVTRSNETVDDDIITETDADAGMYSVKEQVHALTVTKTVLNLQGLLSRDTEKLTVDSQRALRLER